MKKLAVSCWLLAVSVAMAAGVAQAELVEFRDYDASTGTFTNAVRECTLVTGETRILEGGWWAVDDEVAIPTVTNLTVNGTAHLILCDGAKLSVEEPGGDQAAVRTTDATLVIYGQTAGTGVLTATGGSYGSGIGGGYKGSGGVVTINGTVLSAVRYLAPGIGCVQPVGAISGAEFERVEIVDGVAYLGVSVYTNSEVKVIGGGVGEGWGCRDERRHRGARAGQAGLLLPHVEARDEGGVGVGWWLVVG